MFHIEKSPRHANEHYRLLSPLLHKRIRMEIKKEEALTKQDSYLLKLLRWLTEEEDSISNLQRIITGEPEELELLYRYMAGNFLSKNGQWDTEGCAVKEKLDSVTLHQVNVLHKIFNYDVFSKDKEKSYNFVQHTGVHICPYCNQEFVFSVKNRNKYIARSDLDHYLPKSRFPMFALSYYNLIPSGGTCNSNIKGARELDIRKHFHPYIEDEDKNKLAFYMEYDTPEKTAINLLAAGSERGKEMIEFFCLKDIYQTHTNESDHILELFEMYPPDQLEFILKILRDNQILFHMDQLLNILYAHYNVENPEDEILGNLRHDLFRQVKEVYR